MSKAANPPRGECRQCWRHAYDRSIHRRQRGSREGCAACIDHMNNGHPDQLIVK
jgi:hypothetical protein